MLDLSHSTELCRVFADPTRVRLLALLEHEELTVAELTRITGLSQSRVSSHLGRLREARLVRDRRDGNSCFYSINGNRDAAAQQLWELIRASTVDPVIEKDLVRIGEVIRARDGGGWADSVAGHMHRHYSPGRTWESAFRAILGLARLGRVLDIASGDGVLAELLAQRADSVTCLDLSGKVVAAGRERLAHLPNFEFVQGDMHALPFPEESFDEVLLLSALTYAHDPRQVLGEAARVLVPGGSLVASTLGSHRHREEVLRYDHRVLGFEPAELSTLLTDSGLSVEICDRTCRELRQPHFEIITIHARKPGHGGKPSS